MSDAEVQILIQAVDNVSKVMQNIEKTLDSSNKQIKKQTENTSEAFKEQTGKLIKLGQSVQTVDNIFDNYQNMQIRIENATERVNGATDRLADAQYNLSEVMKSGTASAEDIANAQRQVESAQRGLIVSTNNLTRANNEVIGTMINMGIQSASLIAMNPILGISLLALGGALKIFEGMQKATNESLAEYNHLQELAAKNTDESAIVYGEAVKDNEMYSQAIVDTDAKIQAINDEMTASIKREADQLRIGNEAGILAEQKFRKEKQVTLDYLTTNFIPEVNKAYKILHDQFMNDRNKEIDIILRQVEAQNKLNSVGGGYGGKGATTINTGPKVPTNVNTTIKKVNDAIITPRGQVIETNPNDYIYASKNGGMGGTNVYVNVEGNLTAQEELIDIINDALQRKLSYRMSMGN